MNDDPELQRNLDGFIDAVNGFMAVTDQIWCDLMGLLATMTGFAGEVSWPPSDALLDHSLAFLDNIADDADAPLSVEDRAEMICQLEQIRADREAS